MRKLLTIFMALMIFATILPASASDVRVMAGDAPSISFTDVINGVQVRITSTTSGASIYYTLDGTTPTENSNLYEGPFVLSEAKSYRIRAAAYRNGERSNIASENKTLQDCGVSRDPNELITVTRVSGGRYRVDFLNALNDYTVYYTIGKTTRPTINSSNIKNAAIYITKPTVINLLVCSKGYAPTLIQIRATQPAWEGKPVVEDVSVEIQSYYGGKTVTLSTKTEDATIYYIKSGSSISRDVTTSSTKYTEPIRLDEAGNYYIKAFAVKDGYFESDQTSSVPVAVYKCAKPIVTISNVANSTRKVVAATVSDDSEIYYTTDGTTPNESSKRYTGPITLGEDYDLRFVAINKGYVNSDIVTRSVKASGGNPLSVSASTANDGAKTITISSVEEDAEIYYAFTPDSTPAYYPQKGRDKLYSGPIVIDESSDQYLWARAYVNGAYGPLFYAHITVNMLQLDIRLENLTNGIKAATIYTPYDNRIYYVASTQQVEAEDVPLTDENLYTYPLTVNETRHITAVEVDDSGKIVDSTYKYVQIPNGPITPDKVSGISMQSESYGGIVSATLECADSEADIFYVFDWNSSTVAGTGDAPYTRGEILDFDRDGYLHVVAARPGYEYSYETYQIYASKEKTAAPTINAEYIKEDGSYLVTFTSRTPNARFYYTIDGTNPTEASEEAPLGRAYDVPENVTVKVIAIADGYAPSDVVSEILTGDGSAQCGFIYYETGDIIGGKIVSLASYRTDDATIYYTTNGSRPTANSLVYNDNDGIRVTSEGKTLIRAVAVKSGYEDSELFELEVELERVAVPTAQMAQDYGRTIIRMNVPEGATVYYTKDGSIPVPEVDGTEKYSGQFTIYETSTIMAVAARPGYVTSYLYMNRYAVRYDIVAAPSEANLTHTPVMGGEELEITCDIPGASIYYSFEPGALSSITPNILYTGPILIDKPAVGVTIVAKKTGMRDSTKVRFNISQDKAPVPKASIATNSVVNEGTMVELSVDGSADVEYVIFYTTDGSTPTVKSAQYTAPIEVTGDMRIRAIAAAVGVTASDVLELYYRVDDGKEPDLIIDTDLVKENNWIHGSVTVHVNGVDLDGRRVLVALYSDGEMIDLISRDDVAGMDEIKIGGFDALTETEGGIVVKAFVLEDDYITPVCQSATYIEI